MNDKVNNLSTEELLEQVDQASDTNEVQITDNVLIFLREFDLKPGAEKVKTKLLYKLYQAWTKNPLSFARFTLELSLHFDRHKDFVLINYDSIKLSQTTKDFYLKTNSKQFVVDNYLFKHMSYFLEKYEIVKGNTLVDRELIWKSYKEHSRGKKNALTKAKFFKYVDLFLTKKDKKYLVNGFLYNEEKSNKKI